MRKIALAVLAVVVMFSLSGCSFLRDLGFVNTTEEAERMAQEIISALDTHDKEALRNLFSEETLVEADDLDDGLDYIMGTYQNGFLASKPQSPREERNYGQGRYMVQIWVQCDIQISGTEYTLLFDYRVIDESEPETVGLTYVKLVETSRIEGEFELRQDKRRYSSSYSNRLGIYRPEWDSDQDKIDTLTQGVFVALDTKNKEALRSLFSEKTLAEVGDMDKDLAYIMNLCQMSPTEVVPDKVRIVEHQGPNRNSKIVYGHCVIFTDTLAYFLYFEYQITDISDSSAMGLTYLWFADPNAGEGRDDYRDSASCGNRHGTYRPEWDAGQNQDTPAGSTK